MLIFRIKAEYFNSAQKSYEFAQRLRESYNWCKENNSPLFVTGNAVEVYSDGDNSEEIQVYFQDRRDE